MWACATLCILPPSPTHTVCHDSPSVRRALPPVGVHSTEEQLPQSTTDCECEKTVVLHNHTAHRRVREELPTKLLLGPADYCEAASTHMLKQPWHLTSMKKEFGDCTKRFSLCIFFSCSGVGLRRSISAWSTWTQKTAQN